MSLFSIHRRYFYGHLVHVVPSELHLNAIQQKPSQVPPSQGKYPGRFVNTWERYIPEGAFQDLRLFLVDARHFLGIVFIRGGFDGIGRQQLPPHRCKYDYFQNIISIFSFY